MLNIKYCVVFFEYFPVTVYDISLCVIVQSSVNNIREKTQYLINTLYIPSPRDVNSRLLIASHLLSANHSSVAVQGERQNIKHFQENVLFLLNTLSNFDDAEWFFFLEMYRKKYKLSNNLNPAINRKTSFLIPRP